MKENLKNLEKLEMIAHNAIVSMTAERACQLKLHSLTYYFSKKIKELKK